MSVGKYSYNLGRHQEKIRHNDYQTLDQVYTRHKADFRHKTKGIPRQTSMKLHDCEAIEIESVEEVSVGLKSLKKALGKC